HTTTPHTTHTHHKHHNPHTPPTTHTNKTHTNTPPPPNNTNHNTHHTNTPNNHNNPNPPNPRNHPNNNHHRLPRKLAPYQSHQITMLFLNRSNNNRFNYRSRSYIVCGNSRCNQVGRDSCFWCLSNTHDSRLNSNIATPHTHPPP
ncbi:hypothetical protein ACTHUM_20015, partial [Neisseria sp. P0021.S006]|uniref:hypothetical protein n=1 Tax=Neisseria sp. P0021.S006 TaxID=3436821 RepID=UPI003F819B0A